jgi:hypothetical protein
VADRWEQPSLPDVQGVQLCRIQEYLTQHPHVLWVWYDYSSMPQKDGSATDEDGRTPSERREFKNMLASINDLYLTCCVLVLLDNSYMSRFWTLMEARSPAPSRRPRTHPRAPPYAQPTSRRCRASPLPRWPQLT